VEKCAKTLPTLDIFGRRVPYASFDARSVSAVDTRLSGRFSLTPTLLSPRFFQFAPDSSDSLLMAAEYVISPHDMSKDVSTSDIKTSSFLASIKLRRTFLTGSLAI
jgi:hypothetical protein